MTATLDLETPAVQASPDADARTSERSRARRALSALLTFLFSAAVIAFAVAALGIGSGRWQANPVTSGSMEPTIPTGGLVVTQTVDAEDVEVGDVMLFQRPDAPDEEIVHRVVAIDQTAQGPIFHTKGDANEDGDAWQIRSADGTAQLARWDVPNLGYAAQAVRNVFVLIGAAAVAGLAFGISLLRRSGSEEAEHTSSPQLDDRTAAGSTECA